MTGRSNLEILGEEVLVGIPRGRDGREEMRVTRVRARAEDGKEIGWISVGLFWHADDGWRRGKNVATVRLGEADAVARAIAKAVGSLASSAPQRPAGTRAPQHRESHARQPSLPPPPTPDGVNDDEVF
jgi:hypothetical protein